MKKRLLFTVVAMVLILGCSKNISHADYGYGDTSDEPYYFSNLNSTGHSNYRFKYNYSRVYVNPQSGPMIYYTVYAAFSEGGSGLGAVSGTYAIPVNVQASITNTAMDSGRYYVRLNFQRMVTIMNQTTWGYWSPDSTQNYTIYGD